MGDTGPAGPIGDPGQAGPMGDTGPTGQFNDTILVLNQNQASSTYETINRIYTNVSTTVVSGTQYFVLFTPLQTFTANIISMATGDISANGAALIKFGLYTIDIEEGYATLVAQTSSNTSLFNNPYTVYSNNLTASYTVNAGYRYALSFIVIADTTPSIYGLNNGGFLTNLPPKVVGALSGQNDLVSIATDIQLSASNFIQWIKLT
jgi:hypothetical protein